MKKKDIDKLPDHLKVDLIKLGYKYLDEQISTGHYYGQSQPKRCALWHDIMQALEDE